MNQTTPRPLRALFLTLTLILSAFVGGEIALARTADAAERDGLTACGTEAAPCTLAPVAVEAADEAQFVATGAARNHLRMRS